MAEEIGKYNQHLLQWIKVKLDKATFEGDSDALANYILALLETYALKSADDKDKLAADAATKGKCVEDLNDFLGDDTPAFVEGLFKELESHPLQTSPQDEQEQPDISATRAREEEEDPAGSRDVDEDELKRRGSDRFGRERKDIPGENEESRARDDIHRQRRDNRDGRDQRDVRADRDNRDRDHRGHRDERGPREGRDSWEGRDNRDRRWRNDGGDRRFHGSRNEPRNDSRHDMPSNEVKPDAMPAGQGPFSGMPPLNPFQMMKMMAMAAGNNGQNAAPPPPIGMGFPFGPFMGNAQGGMMDPNAKDTTIDSNRRGQQQVGFSGWARGRGGGQRGGPPGTHDAAPNRPTPSMNKSTLYVRNLPQDKINMPDIYEYFSKFGNVTNIQLRPATNPDRAFVEFSTSEEAAAAMNSVEAVMGNRHVRLHWARESDYGAGPGGDNQETPMQDNSKSVHQTQKPVPFPGRGGRGRGRRGRGRGDPMNTGGASRADFTAQQGEGDEEATREDAEKAEEEKKAAEKAAEEVNARKRKEVLAVREEQKKQKLEREKEETEEKKRKLAEVMRKIEQLESEKDTMSAEEKKKQMQELKADAVKLNASLSAPKTAESNSNAKLDALQAQLSAIKKEVKDLGYDPDTRRGGYRGGFRARGPPHRYRPGFRGRGRGRGFPAPFPRGNMSLDLRPKELLMEGIADDSSTMKAKIRGAFPSIETIEKGDDGLLHMKFQNHNAAEAALKTGASQFGEGVSLKWSTSKSPKNLKKQDEEGGEIGANQEAGGDGEEIEVDYEEE
mmetsp:Transcript_9673/g.29392  ORF Transcript_9673/g.29392 Transcript_9673/m.29392 type:complete len:785 (+) Transcript_9673:234-2588(+)